MKTQKIKIDYHSGILEKFAQAEYIISEVYGEYVDIKPKKIVFSLREKKPGYLKPAIKAMKQYLSEPDTLEEVKIGGTD